MKLSHYSHITDTGLFFSLHNFWWGKHPGQSPRNDNEMSREQRRLLNKCFSKGIVSFLLAVSAVGLGFIVKNQSGTAMKVLIGLGILCLIPAARYLWSFSVIPVPDSAIWNRYQMDLEELFEAFPVLNEDSVQTGEDALREIGKDIQMRVTQIAAKQRAGFVVDAMQERQALIEDHSVAYKKFGMAKEIGQYFSDQGQSGHIVIGDIHVAAGQKKK